MRCTRFPAVPAIAAALAIAAFPVAAEVRMGVDQTAKTAVPPHGVITFDPPCLFTQSLPLTGVHYLNPRTKVIFKGSGVLLNECAGFGVTGHSPPNYLAWNCEVEAYGGGPAELPEFFEFTVAMSYVKLKVAAGPASIGGKATLTAYDAKNVIVTRKTVTLSSTMKRLEVRGFRNIRRAMLKGPCTMVADDLLVRK